MGFRVLGLGFRVLGLGFRVLGLGLRVLGVWVYRMAQIASGYFCGLISTRRTYSTALVTSMSLILVGPMEPPASM